jgi:hypothetical protein
MFFRICRVITILASCLAAIELAFTIFGSNSAPQQAAGAAIAAAMVIIPYVFTRMCEIDLAAEANKPQS